MTDVSVKATLSGFSEAKQGVEQLGAAMGDLSKEGYTYAQITENLKRLGEERAAALKKEREATAALKAHTADLVRQFNEQERAQAFANSVVGQGISALSSYAAKALSVVAVAGAVVKVLHDIDSSGRESAEASLRLGAALTSTGGVVGRTQHQLEGMADAMQAATRFDDTSIKRAQSIMLTFSNVTGETFERGMALAADYSELLGGDLSSSARIFGRALNDPVNGIGMLSRAIGRLDPETQLLIKTFQESGDTASAQGVLIEALEKKFGGFAKTIGGDSVAAVDKLRNAWSNLMQELAKSPDDPSGGKGVFGWYYEGIARNLNYAKNAVVDFNTWRHKNEVETLTKLLASNEGDFQDRSAWQRRLTEITKNEGTNRTKNEAEALAKEAEHRKKMDEEALLRQVEHDDKLAAEWLKKRKAEAEAVKRHQKQLTNEQERAEDERRRIERETFELSVRTRDRTLEDYKDFIDSQLTTARKGSKEEIALMKERAKITEDIFKREDQLQKQKEAQLEDERKSQKELQEVIKKRALEEIAHLESLNIQNGNLVKMEGDERIRALEALAAQYAAMGAAGELAYLAIQSEIRKTRTTAEEDFSAMRQVFGRLTFDMVGLFGNVHKSVTSNLADMMKGNQTVADGIKGIFTSMVDSIINEFARLAANDILSGVMQLLGVSSMRTGGSLLGGLLGGGGSRGGRDFDAGGGGIGLVKSLFGGAGSAADFASGYAAIQGLSAAEAAALIESGTVGFAGAGMESAALGFSLAEGATSFLPYAGWAMLASKALGIDIGGAVGSFASGIGDVAGDIFSGIGDIFGFATGGESVVTKPTLFMAGESGAERVRVSPMAGGPRSSGGITNVFNGPTIMDPYTMRLWLRGQERLMRQSDIAGR